MVNEEQGEIFDFAFDNELPFDKVAIPSLYHYRSANSVKSIFMSDGIRLRMRRGDTFPDKMEGKAIEVYYDIALEELLQEKRICQDQYDFLSQLEIGREDLFVFDGPDAVHHAKWLPSDVFVICFSSVGNDHYMFENYGGSNQDKYCLEVSAFHLEMLSHTDLGAGTRTELFQIMYGRQVVLFLKQKILQITGSEILYENAEVLLSDLLRRTQYASKLAKYSKENEIRLIVYLPHGELFTNDHYETDGDEWLWLNLPREAVSRCRPRETNTPEKNREVEQLLQDTGYGYLI